MKIIGVELNHLAHDLDNAVTHVTLDVELEDHTWGMVEVKLPAGDDVARVASPPVVETAAAPVTDNAPDVA